MDILAADFSYLLHGRGVTLYPHTAENAMRLHQEPIPCRLREATFVLDALHRQLPTSSTTATQPHLD
ncbi:MAG: Tn3 family transposase [Chloroflexi bacterium]|nr:Tn3 family transposase [Chloroflexota bacterium]